MVTVLKPGTSGSILKMTKKESIISVVGHTLLYSKVIITSGHFCSFVQCVAHLDFNFSQIVCN